MLLTNFHGWNWQAHLLLLQTAFKQESDGSVYNLGLNHHYTDSLGDLIFEFAFVAVCLFNKTPVLHTNTPVRTQACCMEQEGSQGFSVSSRFLV